jgi:t-SNARE complex subunit (syntaxin)
VGDFEKEVRAFQAAKVAYSRDSERAGPPRPDGSAAAEGGGDGGGRRDGGDEESGSRVQRQEFARKLRDGRVDLAYELAEERKEATSAIHREAVSVREAAQDLANLVNDQDEGITAIESQVTEAKDAVVEGNNDLETTIEYQKALRKKWCFCLIIGVLILLAICIPVLLHLTKSS